MYNTDMPTRAELPTSAKLIRSTAIAFFTAAVLLVTVVMPADYGIDPTGIGRALNLTQMGEIKKELAAEAAADEAAQAAGAAGGAAAPAVQSATTAAPVVLAAPTPVASAAAVVWRDETPVTLEPGAGIEIKLTMKEGDKALFDWAVQGGVVNFDTHGESFPRSISYEKGRGVAAKQGELVAAFSGKHGWFFRNRGNAPVTVLLKTGGTYSEIDR
jgi:hypothetical protein